MIGEEGNWRKVTIAEAREFASTNLIYWRPKYVRASIDNPDEDQAYVLDEEPEKKKRKGNLR